MTGDTAIFTFSTICANARELSRALRLEPKYIGIIEIGQVMTGHTGSLVNLGLEKAVQEIMVPENSCVPLSLYASSVQAGFPSAADDFIEKTLDLNEHLIKHPASTFFVRVAGDSMIGVGIQHNDILVVDRSLQAKPGSIIIAIINGEFTVKRLKLRAGQYVLAPENPDYQEIIVRDELVVWGVVTSVIHQFA